MAARVFVSCGQASIDERRVATDVAAWLSSAGFKPYVAIDVQTILDLNSGIIGALKESDYYLFINFRRERLLRSGTLLSDVKQLLGKKEHKYRGSLYTHQELAVAYALGFQNFILINERGCLIEGILKFIVSNVSDFSHPSEVLSKVQSAVTKAGWSPYYSRQLSAKSAQFVGPSYYKDHAMIAPQHRLFLHGEIANGRPDIAARHTICRLMEIRDTANALIPHSDHSPLKAVSIASYEQTVWPGDSGKFDLLSINVQNANEVYLHSGKDLYPRLPVISASGTYTLKYAVMAEGFMPTEFTIELKVTGSQTTTSARILPK